MLRFVLELIAFRRRHPCLTANRFFTGAAVPGRALPDISWYGIRLDEQPWHAASGRFLRFTLAGLAPGEGDLHAILNMLDQAVMVVLPAIASGCWHLALDTSQLSPNEILARGRQEPHPGATHLVSACSVAVFEARAVE
jgi:isoamylase